MQPSMDSPELRNPRKQLSVLTTWGALQSVRWEITGLDKRGRSSRPAGTVDRGGQKCGTVCESDRKGETVYENDRRHLHEVSRASLGVAEPQTSRPPMRTIREPASLPIALQREPSP